MNKAKFVSDWIKNKVASGTPGVKLAQYFVCGESSISHLKNMHYPNSPLTGKAFEIIKAMEKEDWPTWETVRESEKEMTPKPKTRLIERLKKLQTWEDMESNFYFLANEIEKVNKPSNDELSRAVRKVDEQGFRIVEINDKANKLLVQVNAQKGQIAELREQMERSFEPMDEWRLMVMETKQKFESLSDFFDEEMLSLYNRVTSLENRYKEQSKQPRTGLIRKLWRWLW